MPGCTVAVRFSGETSTADHAGQVEADAALHRDHVTFEARAAPKGVTGTWCSVASASVRETSSVDSAYTTSRAGVGMEREVDCVQVELGFAVRDLLGPEYADQRLAEVNTGLEAATAVDVRLLHSCSLLTAERLWRRNPNFYGNQPPA